MTKHFSNKKSFFAALDELDELDNEDEEYDDSCEGPLTSADKGIKIPNLNKVVLSSERTPFTQANSDSRPSCHPQSKRDSTSDTLEVSTANTPPMNETMSATKNGTPRKKRKTNSGRIIPDDQQIFDGLIFFFFPNNDVSPFRRLRIQRAQEYGARWSRTWASDVTHVISDRGLQSSDLLDYLKIDALPTGVVLVNETYPSECIQFRLILNPSQLRFRVDGSPIAAKENSPVVEVPPLDSLPLKPSRRQTYQSPDQYHSSSEKPSLNQLPKVSSEITPKTVPKTVSDTRVECLLGATTEQTGIKAIWERDDALDNMINEAKATSHLPLDPLESPVEDGADDASDIETTGSEDESSGRTRKITYGKGQGREKSDWTEGFACMQKFDAETKPVNPNNRTIEVLQQMLAYYTQTADQWRIIAYRKAINALRQQSKRITTRAQARGLSGVGERLADKIEEIVLTNRLRCLEYTNDTPEDLIIQEFLGIYGVGLSQASRWVAQGYTSLGDLLERAPLSRPQRIGVERYNDFAQRIPRKEVEAHGAIVRKAVQAVDRDMQVIIGGSYRRGAVTCGDVDCLITKPGASLEHIRTIMLGLVVPRLFSNGFLQASLAVSSRQDGSKWHGASAIPGSNLWRRIDLLFVPDAEIGAALIYFTGNDIFNRSMRLLARRKGMCLNQKGLYTDVLRTQQVKLNAGRLVEGRDERRIFAALGVPWRPPEHRIC
ncbi:DNA polymerase family X [Penicillium paradoxum]|uniref:DNA polymerase family X n=1 Tax=Penicillium paradoxum TaxID=176176 RepID=UPI002548B6D4|nr:DNA polymerase family X [Penicillium paradoxum]KAJ5794131.1 DNA polymerase family X [Penicillium paradoxum]